MTEKKRSYWLIEGFEGTELKYSTKIPYTEIATTKVKHAIKCLAAKTSLSNDEIVYAYTNNKCAKTNKLLAVKVDKPYAKFSCGENSFFTARIIKEGTT